MIEEREIRHFHFCCGLGAAALGFNRGRAELNGMRGRFRCIGGVDSSPAAVRDFTRITGVRGTVLDLFDRQRGGALGVKGWSDPSGAVAGESLPPNGALAVADPRFPNSQGEHGTKYHVQPWNGPSDTITGSDRVGSGALCVADPRCGMQRGRGDNYLTAGHYGVVPWDESCGAVSAAAGHDSGRWNVADPRLPEANEKLVAVIRSLDNTRHRPFTTLELAALQSLVDPENLFDLDGTSDSAKRERIGNAVPPRAAQAIADLMGQTLLMAWSGQTFALSATPIWVRPIVVALSVKTPEAIA